jgi:hypothetical protein
MKMKYGLIIILILIGTIQLQTLGIDAFIDQKKTHVFPQTIDPSFDMEFEKDFFPGTVDENGCYMGGTETRWLVSHKGELFAGMSYWGDAPGSDPALGGQVLRKKSASSDWQVDKTWGSEYIGVYALTSITFQTDQNGEPLSSNNSILLASLVPKNVSGNPVIWVRNDQTGEWIDVTLSEKTYERPAARNMFSHVDTVTGIHYVFVGIDGGDLYCGVYNNTLPTMIQWNPIPELSIKHGSRFLSAAIANGEFYIGLMPERSFQKIGGVYHRIDGINPEWECVYEWKTYLLSWTSGMRGLTAVPDPMGRNHEVLLGVRESPGVIERIDPLNNYSVTVEMDIRDYFESFVGPIDYPKPRVYYIIRNSLYAAYNDMCKITNPENNQSLNVFGVFIRFSDTLLPPNNGAWYLIRDEQGNYTHGFVYDDTHLVVEGEYLRAARTIIKSPFPEEKEAYLYFGGYDSAGQSKHNTAWIYKGKIVGNIGE